MKSTDYNVGLNLLRFLPFWGSAVKTHRRFLLPGLLLSFIVIAQPATARADRITMTNKLKERVKICVYYETDRFPFPVIPMKCWTIDAGKSAVWDRGKDKFTFIARVFRPALIDQEICSGNGIKGEYFFVDGSPCRIYSSPNKPAPELPPADEAEPTPIPAKNYTLRVCNTTGATVQFALGYFIERVNFVGEGWWLVSKESCMNIDMSEVWKPQGLKDGSFARTFMYAKSGRYFQQIWEGRAQDYDPSFCINQKKAFAIRKFEIKDNQRFLVPCKGTNLEEVYFFGIPNPEFNSTYYWTFK